jgi:mannitol/fructose-specific phosphotransferase system IIA component (Ntr-type)
VRGVEREECVTLHSLLAEDLIVSDLESRTRDEALKKIVGVLKSGGRISRAKNLYDKLVQRERLGSTAIGDGVAIPHCRFNGVKSPIVALGVSRPGMDFGALDGKPTHLLFTIVSSPDDPGTGLRVLAAVAQLARKATALPERIMEARSPRAVIDIIRDEEDRSHG